MSARARPGGNDKSIARGVGCKPLRLRTNRSSSSSDRSLASAALIAGWVRPMRRPALVTLRSDISASNATSKFRSMPGKSIGWMSLHTYYRWIASDHGELNRLIKPIGGIYGG